LFDILRLIGFGAEGWGKQLAIAALMTIAISSSGFALGVGIGIVIAWARISRVSVIRYAGICFTTLIRGVPELLLIYLLFFGGTQMITEIASVLFQNKFLTAPVFLTCILALGLISGSYNAEVFRGAWNGIDVGQIEAARAYGMKRTLMFKRIIAPQLLRLALPGLGNIWQLTLKESALISITGLTELMRQSIIASSATDKPFLFYSSAAAIYLLITRVSASLFATAERQTNRGVR
jgi:octopine/nopaline transport system permease protein